MKKKLLVLDIDGTLTNSMKEITERTKLAVKKLFEAGHSCMIATGRPTPGVMFIAKELEFEKWGGYVLSYNGARVINCKTNEVVSQQTLDNGYLPELFEFAETHDCGIITYNDEAVLTGRRTDEYIQFESNLLRLPTIWADFNKIDFPVNKCLVTAEGNRAGGLCDVLAEKYRGVMSIYRSEPFFIEVMPLNVDKAKSIEKILPDLGFERDDCICCGDGYNDVSMIKFAGVGVAMKNAVAEVKEVCDVMTLSNDEDGVAHYIENYLLEK